MNANATLLQGQKDHCILQAEVLGGSLPPKHLGDKERKKNSLETSQEERDGGRLKQKPGWTWYQQLLTVQASSLILIPLQH